MERGGACPGWPVRGGRRCFRARLSARNAANHDARHVRRAPSGHRGHMSLYCGLHPPCPSVRGARAGGPDSRGLLVLAPGIMSHRRRRRRRHRRRHRRMADRGWRMSEHGGRRKSNGASRGRSRGRRRSRTRATMIPWRLACFFSPALAPSRRWRLAVGGAVERYTPIVAFQTK